jgi:hypothetical protein
MGVPLDKKICLNTKCNSTDVHKLKLPSNWGGCNGTLIHHVLEIYAQACKEKAKADDWRLDWKTNYINGYFGRLEGFKMDPKIFDMMWLTKKNQAKGTPIGECGECVYNCDMEAIGETCPKKLFADSLGMIDRAIKRYDNLFKEKCLETEQKFKIKLGEYKGLPIYVNGFIDVIFKLDKKTIEVVDYKSGTATKCFGELMEDNQAGIYSFAVRHLYPGYENYYLTFDYFQRAPVTVTFTEYQEEAFRERVVSIFKQVVDNQSPRRIPLCRDGSLFFKCQYLCDRPTCDKQWKIFQNRYGRSGL